MAASTEQRELELVEKVYFRILSVANNEEKLQNLLKVYLTPVILKLGSEYASVRNKVLLTTQFNPAPSIIMTKEPSLILARRSWRYVESG